MIETLELRDPRPARRVMTGLARCGEAAFVRVRVASRARGKGKTRVFHVRLRGIGNRWMAFRTSDGGMGARQRVLCGGVNETRRGTPSVDIVAARAVRAELSMVHVRVTARAIL